MEYLENPKESDINIVFNDSMTMPNVTFCMSRAQAWSHFKINASAPADEWDAIVEVIKQLMNIEPLRLLLMIIQIFTNVRLTRPNSFHRVSYFFLYRRTLPT